MLFAKGETRKNFLDFKGRGSFSYQSGPSVKIESTSLRVVGGSKHPPMELHRIKIRA